MKNKEGDKTLVSAAILGSLLLVGCSGQIDTHLEALDERAEDMTCTAQITPHDNLGSALVYVRLEAPPAPHEIGPGFSHYILWAENPDGQLDNLGKLRFGSPRCAQLLGVTKYETFRLFVTAEPLPDRRTPKGTPLLSSETITIKSP